MPSLLRKQNRCRVWGRHSPTRFHERQIEQMAKFGPMVESCSTLPSLFVFADFSSSRIWRWTGFWKNDKIKRADYTKHQKSAGAWLSLQSDVLCNRLWKFKVGFCLVQLLPTEPKAWWISSALPVCQYRVGWTDYLSICLNIPIFSCTQWSTHYTNIIQTMWCFVKIVEWKHQF